MRRCTRCSHKGPDDTFGVKIKSKANDTGICKTCKSSYNASWYARNKAKHVACVHKNTKRYKDQARALTYKAKDVPCKDCGQRYPPYIMQFDHLDPEQKLTEVSRMISNGFSQATLLAEMAKCEVVCANCHAARTYLRRFPPS